MKQPVPMKAIERLFQRLSLNYGRQFLDLWKDIPLEEIKLEWSQGLSGIDFKEIAAGLEYCLDHHKFPPTLPEFKQLCRDSKRPEVLKALPRNYSDEELQANHERLRSAASVLNHSKGPGTDWAERVFARYAHGEKLHEISVTFAEEALHRSRPVRPGA